jgi:hypothetical protein
VIPELVSQSKRLITSLALRLVVKNHTGLVPEMEEAQEFQSVFANKTLSSTRRYRICRLCSLAVALLLAKKRIKELHQIMYTKQSYRSSRVPLSSSLDPAHQVPLSRTAKTIVAKNKKNIVMGRLTVLQVLTFVLTGLRR